jgi:hypothetical protein
MKKNGIGTLLKTIRILLALIIGAGLSVGNVSADTVCMAKCCSNVNPSRMHHTIGKQIKSVVDCHRDIPRIPCDLQSKPVFELSEYTLTSNSNHFSNAVGPIKILSNFGVDNYLVQLNCFVQTVREKSQPPPIYLQIRSLLI